MLEWRDGEEPLTMAQVAKLHPRGVSVGTVRRWARIGIAGVILESWTEGGERFTTREAYQRFVVQQNHAKRQAKVDNLCRVRPTRPTSTGLPREDEE